MLNGPVPSTACAGSPRGASADRIRDLNDVFRRDLPKVTNGNQLLLTVGVRALGGEQIGRLLIAVRDHADFNGDNDPHGEHDFGVIEQDGIRYFWKIDTYDRDLTLSSPDPADPAVTTRVLTIMRADEY